MKRTSRHPAASVPLHPRRRLLSLGLLSVILATPVVSRAQVRGLDESTFIEGLRREGMSELLLHLSKTEKLEPVEGAQLQVSQYVIQSQNPRLSPEQRIQAINNAVEAQRKLVEEFPDRPVRAIWRTDLAEIALTERMPLLAPRSGDFFEFGVPTIEQRQAFEGNVALAYEMCYAADAQILQLNGKLQNQKDYQEKYVITGLGNRLFRQYGQGRTAYFGALSAFYTSMLPDAHAYFTTLGKNPTIPAPIQKNTPEAERKRLLQWALDKAGTIAENPDINPAVKLAAQCLMARIEVRLKKPTDALERATRVLASQKEDLTSLQAAMTRALALDLLKRTSEANDQLDALMTLPAVRSSIIDRVLVTDLSFRVRYDRAQALPQDQREKAVREAFAPYELLLSDRTLSDESRYAVRSAITSRWALQFKDAKDLSQLPDVVLNALAFSARSDGQDLLLRLQQDPQAPDAAALQKQSQALFQRAIDLCNALLARQDAGEPARAQALFNLGTAIYYTGPDEMSVIAKAIDTWLDLAKKFPAQPVAEQALSQSLGILRSLHSLKPRPPGVDEKYSQAFDLMLEKYPSSKSADNEYAFYAFEVLEPQGKYRQAVTVYDKVPPGHPTYIDARREIVYCLNKLWTKADGDEKEKLAGELSDQAAKTRTLAEEAIPDTTQPEALTALKLASAEARIALAQLDAKAGRLDQALEQLKPFETMYADQPDAIRRGQSERVMVYVASDKLDDASKLATQLMNQAPDQAAPLVNAILNQLDDEVTGLRRRAEIEKISSKRQPLIDLANRRSGAVEIFASLLYNWAQKRSLPGEQMLPFAVVRARALRQTGHAQDALKLIQPYLSDPKLANNADLINGVAEAHLAVGTPQDLDAALKLFTKLINGLEAGPTGYPPLWWNAWTRVLAIKDIQKKNKEVEQLVGQLKGADPNLGGEAYRDEIERLYRKSLVNQ